MVVWVFSSMSKYSKVLLIWFLMDFEVIKIVKN